ncbi:conjugal transfer protein TrbM, partial [Neisseria gonorrhoeae]
MLKKTLICILLVSTAHLATAESLNDALNRSRSGNSNNSRPQVEDLFTGDVKLACEATLCLSTGNRP